MYLLRGHFSRNQGTSLFKGSDFASPCPKQEKNMGKWKTHCGQQNSVPSWCDSHKHRLGYCFFPQGNDSAHGLGLAFRACSCIMLHTSALLPSFPENFFKNIMSWRADLYINYWHDMSTQVEASGINFRIFHPSCSSCSVWSSLSCCVRLATCKRAQTGGRCQMPNQRPVWQVKYTVEEMLLHQAMLTNCSLSRQLDSKTSMISFDTNPCKLFCCQLAVKCS